MAQIRHDMHQEVQGAVKGAQSLTDWRGLVTSHPWLSISVGVGGGVPHCPKRRLVSHAVVAVSSPSWRIASQPRRSTPPGGQGTRLSFQYFGNCIWPAGTNRCSGRAELRTWLDRSSGWRNIRFLRPASGTRDRAADIQSQSTRPQRSGRVPDSAQRLITQRVRLSWSIRWSTSTLVTRRSRIMSSTSTRVRP